MCAHYVSKPPHPTHPAKQHQQSSSCVLSRLVTTCMQRKECGHDLFLVLPYISRLSLAPPRPYGPPSLPRPQLDTANGQMKQLLHGGKGCYGVLSKAVEAGCVCLVSLNQTGPNNNCRANASGEQTAVRFP